MTCLSTKWNLSPFALSSVLDTISSADVACVLVNFVVVGIGVLFVCMLLNAWPGAIKLPAFVVRLQLSRCIGWHERRWKYSLSSLGARRCWRQKGRLQLSSIVFRGETAWDDRSACLLKSFLPGETEDIVITDASPALLSWRLWRLLHTHTRTHTHTFMIG